MQLASLAPSTLDLIRRYDWDGIIEKHEGPESWDAVLRYRDPEFLQVNGHWVLLPVGRSHHANITILRCIVGDDEQSLTIFLKDTTHVKDPADELFLAGFVAVCDRVPGEPFFLAILYHEWYIIEPPDAESGGNVGRTG